MDSRQHPHLTDEQLLLHVDGELMGHDAEEARAHLDACWSCRARLDELQSTIHTIARFRNEILLPSVQAPPTPWPGLRPRLEAVEKELRARSVVQRIRHAWESRRVVPNPRLGMATMVALVVVAVVLWPRPTVVSAKELLTRAEARPVISAHRQLILEEHVPAGGVMVAQRTIDIWHNTETGVKARRLYDEHQQLLAGEWIRQDGSRTIYRRGATPQTASPSAAYKLTLDDLWRVEPSATDFAVLVGRTDEARVEDSHSAYVVEWRHPRSGDADQLLSASLTLSKEDLHPTAHTLETLQAGDIHEFRLTETAFTPVAAAAIPVAALQPDQQLVGELVVVPAVTPIAPPVRHLISTQELIELEVEVLSRLDGVGAFLGEQLTVERHPQRGQLRVHAIVESAARKRDLLDALGPRKTDANVVVSIATIAEAVKQHPQQPSSVAAPPTVKAVEVEKKSLPVHDDLRRHIIDRLRQETGSGAPSHPDEPAVEREIQRFTVKVVDRSLQARLHARALIQVVERFSPEELRGLSANARKSWHNIIRQHAASFQRDTEALRRDLEAIFSSTPLPAQAGVSSLSHTTQVDPQVTSDADLSRAAARLFELGSSHDAAIARTFSLLVEEPNQEPPKWDLFYRSLKKAEQLAGRIGEFVTTQ